MKKLELNDPETKSSDVVSENISALQAVFPDAFREGKIDLDVLKQLLGGAVEDREEKYGLNWHGKRNARQIALTPSVGTLLPCPEDSVDWDTTQNIMVEGDNLEVLKLLQKSYAGKVKLIYIDPPYNTGKDFVYPDDFRNSIKNYLNLTGQIGGDGQKATSNAEASGRFHTDWLNMLLPRVKLARELLASDGILLVSLDEVEVANARAICTEIFGEECFVEQIAWKNKYGSGALTKGFASVHEYILVYSKSPISSIAAPLDDDQRSQYKLKDEKFETRGGYITQPLATTSKDERANLRYPIIHDGNEIWPEKQWIWSKERFDQAYENNEIVINEKNGKFSVRAKQYLRDENGVERLGKPLSLMNGPFNQEGTKDIAGLFDEPVFGFPKPVALVRYFVSMVVNDDSSRSGIYMDFFAGSGTTGHAVLAQNALDGGSRRFVLVQLPERLNSDNAEQKLAANFCDKIGRPQTIAELTKERLRRAAAKIKLDNPTYEGDLGFRAFKLAQSNINAWNPDPSDLEGTLLANAEHIVPGRTEQDILYELLLKLGLDLCVPIETQQIAGKTVHAIGGGALITCLADGLAKDAVESLSAGIVAWWKQLAPAVETRVVFKDSGFADDVAKANMAAILNQNGILDVRSL